MEYNFFSILIFISFFSLFIWLRKIKEDATSKYEQLLGSMGITAQKIRHGKNPAISFDYKGRKIIFSGRLFTAVLRNFYVGVVKEYTFRDKKYLVTGKYFSLLNRRMQQALAPDTHEALKIFLDEFSEAAESWDRDIEQGKIPQNIFATILVVIFIMALALAIIFLVLKLATGSYL